MVQINFATREVSCKVVYYGPGSCGKTTNLHQVHDKAPSKSRGTMTSIATEGDRTLFFDFMPLELGTVAGMKTKMQLYTVPGQVYYNATRRIVLEGVDGIVFVADSSPSRREANLESWQNLKDNLNDSGLDIIDVPLGLQFNKRDLPDAMPVEQMNTELNDLSVDTFEAAAVTGEGVMSTLRKLSSLVLQRLNQQRPRRGTRRPAAPSAPAKAREAASAVPVRTVRKQPATPPVSAREKPSPTPEPAPTPVVAGKAAEPARAATAKVEKPSIPSLSESPAPSTTEPQAVPPVGRPRVIMAGEPTKKPVSKLVLVVAGILVIVVVVVVALMVSVGR